MTAQAPLQIILDTDPGGDDVFALLWLLSLAKQGFVELIAVTATHGNVLGDRTFLSASQILNLVGFAAIEVGRGVPLPTAAIANAAHIHGADGMGNLSHTLPAATHSLESARSADDVIIDRLSTAPGEITLVAIGPLTNLAAAELKCPGILKQAKEIVIMGGAFHRSGNVTPQAEFNLWFNPVAAATVFRSRSDSVVLPLDITTRLILTTEMMSAIVQINPSSQMSRFLTQLCEFMISTALSYRETNGISGFLVHDAATVGYLLYPETLMLKRARVQVETKGEWTLGQTLIDRRKTPNSAANAWIALDINEAAFFTHFIADLQQLVAQCQ
jgi:inosine-uridine nucleoside N-ribohydrolase